MLCYAICAVMELQLLFVDDDLGCLGIVLPVFAGLWQPEFICRQRGGFSDVLQAQRTMPQLQLQQQQRIMAVGGQPGMQPAMPVTAATGTLCR